MYRAGNGRLVSVFILGLGFALLLVASGRAWAETGGADGPSLSGSSETAFVAGIVLLLIVGRGLGEILQRLGQPAVMGQLIGGIALGPSLFGWLWPSAQHFVFSSDPVQKSMIDAVSQLGILMLLLLTGMETDLKLVRRVRAACVSISTTGVLVPFACGFALAQFLPGELLPEPDERIVAGLFLGTALSISSVKIVAMVVREMNFMRRDIGQIIVSSAIIEDTVGWLIIAVTFGIATHGKVEVLSLLGTITAVAAFMVFSFTLGRRIVFTLIRWTNDVFRSEYAVITMILIIMGVMALITDLIGVHTVLGAFIAGILVGESPILSDHIETQLRGIITALFMPIFFGVAGLSADLTVLVDPTLALLTLGLVVIASVGKFSGAFMGGKFAGLSWKEATAIGCGMNARGSTEVIVASIGLSMGILSQNLFTMIVTMAVLTTLAMPPMLRWALARLPMGEKEKERVEREELDQRGFVSKLQRLLLAADDSAIGKFSAHLAGLIGGGRGTPTTFLHLTTGTASAGAATGKGPQKHMDTIRKGAKASATAAKESDDSPVEKVHLSMRSESGATGKTIREEARKGYDMLLVGLNNSLTQKGDFTARLNDLASGFDGPLCIVVKGFGATGRMPTLQAGETILVPVNGTDASRHAAELALAMARPNRARVKALYVSQEGKSSRKTSISHQHEEAVLKDIAQLGERYGVSVLTAMRMQGGAGEAIRKEAARGIALIVMGVTQRPGDELFFGDTAANVLQKCRGPIVLLTTGRVQRDDAEQEAIRSAVPVEQDDKNSGEA
ncbi:cation:proton antiporter domain-containing protein [Mesorhizobium sp. A556]